MLPSLNAARGALVLAAALALSCAGAAAAQDDAPAPVTPAEIEAAIPGVVAMLPMRIDEVTQVVGVRAEGTEFVYDVAISEPIPADRIEQFRRDAQVQGQIKVCESGAVALFFRRGGGMRYRYSDTTGYRFETRIASCP